MTKIEKNIFRLLTNTNFTVVGFYTYDSIVMNRICETNHNNKIETICDQELAGFFTYYLNIARQKALALKKSNVGLDNKIVIRISIKPAEVKDAPKETYSDLFIGYKDGEYHLGLSCTQWYGKYIDLTNSSV